MLQDTPQNCSGAPVEQSGSDMQLSRSLWKDINTPVVQAQLMF